MFKLSHFRTLIALPLALAVFTAHAQNDKKKKAPPPPPRPAAPAPRPAPAPQQQRSAPPVNNSHPGTTTTTNHPQPTINNPGNRPQPTINNPGNRPQPTVNNPGNHPGPTIGHPEPGPRPSTTNTGTTNRPTNPHPMPNGAKPVTTRSGSTIVNRPNGHPSDVHDVHRGIDVHHGLDGSRRVSVMRADHSHIVAMRGRPGFIERPYAFHGHDFARRTYYFHGRAYDRFYHGYDFRGAHFAVYAPGLYYRSAFYGWAYAPWGRPISYAWGWGPSPWVGYYGYYFTPYPTYPSASFWLTDYMISNDLSEQYQAQADANALAAAPAPGDQPMLTAQDKQMIADEVRNQLALENAEAAQTAAGQDVDPASSSIARMISDGKPHVFVVGGPLDVVDASGNECSVSEGDALVMLTPPPADSPVAQLNVLASKGGNECSKSDNVNVALADLQEMQNHMRERIDQGLADLQAKQGQSGLPTLPPSANAPGAPAPFVAIAPPPDPNGAAEVTQQLAAADQSEQQVLAEAGQQPTSYGPSPDVAPPPPVAPPTISVGQTIDQVVAAFGQPVTIVDLGAKKIYQYKDMKVTFRAGKVADIQ